MEVPQQTNIIEVAETVRAAIVHREQSGRLLYLVLQRNWDDEYRRGEYDVPGGAVEAGESWLDAIVRETREEAGMELQPNAFKRVGKRVTHKDHPDGGAVEIRRELFVAEVEPWLAEQAVAGSEHCYLGWKTWEEAEVLLAGCPYKQSLAIEAGCMAIAGELTFAS